MRRYVAVMVLAAGGICALALGQAGGPATTAPTTQPTLTGPPKPTVVPLTWEFGIEYDELRPIAVKLLGRDKPQLFWYLRYTVTNRSDREHFFVPEFVLYTNTGQLLRAGRNTPTAVFFQIKKLHNDPLLKTQTSMTRKILLGQDNAKAGVGIWPDFDPNTGIVDVFIGGLSGETKSIALPKPVQITETDLKGKKRTVSKSRLLLAKTLHLRYRVPGEAANRLHVRPKLLKKQWVMR